MSKLKRKYCEASKNRQEEEYEYISKKQINNKVKKIALEKEQIQAEEAHSDSSTMDQIDVFQKDKNEKLQLKLAAIQQDEQYSEDSSTLLPANNSSQLIECNAKSEKQIEKSGNENEQNFDSIYQQISKPQEIFDCKYKPSVINFRDKEKNEIQNFLLRCINDKLKNKCLLLTGMPGCGKTLTTLSLLEEFSLKQKKFEYLKFNAMSYSNQISFLDDLYFKMFHKTTSNASQELTTKIKQSKRATHLTIFIDEFDNLFHGNSQEIFTLFNICSLPNANISLIGVSNSMEIVFQLSKKYKIILPDMKNLVFEPYSQKEIYQIMKDRLKEMSEKLSIPETIIDDKALRLCSGKMYNLKSGDIRCLFDVCKKALEQTNKGAEILKSSQGLDQSQENEYPSVTIPQLTQIIDKLYKVSYKFLKDLPTEQQLVLLSIYQVIKEKAGIVEVTINQTKASLDRICKYLSIESSQVNKIQEILEILQSYQILTVRNKESAGNPRKKVSGKAGDNISVFLKLSTEDIEDVLEEEEKFSQIFAQYKNNDD